MAKKHGLWRFHRAAKAAGVNWLVKDELEAGRFLIRREIQRNAIGRDKAGPPYRDTDVIQRCAQRYIRLYRLPMIARVYNAVCERIANRASFYTQSLRAASAYQSTRGSPLGFRPGEWTPLAAWCDHEANERLERRRDFCQRKREQSWEEVFQAQRCIADINQAIRAASKALKEKTA